LTLKIPALRSFETPETARPATQCHIPDFTEHLIVKTKLQYVNFKYSVAYDYILYQLNTTIINIMRNNILVYTYTSTNDCKL